MDFLGLFQENPPRWGGPETNFFLRGVGGSASFSFLGPRNQGYFSFLGARCEAGYINTFCEINFCDEQYYYTFNRRVFANK